ncbi:lymphokine-activated killer T-cell-originated protein kinase isoform X2 [Periplaneta americana]
MEECDSSVGDLIEERVNEELGPFSVEKILKVALDVAKALDYLHRECHLLHGDIKSFNVLVKGDFEVIKLCDFGVSVPLNEDGVLDKAAGSHYVGTSCWLAPEALKNDGIIPVTNKADIFSFGLVLWEMMTLKIPNFDHSLDEDLSMLELSTTDADDEWLMHSETDLKYGTRPSLPEAELGDEYKPIIELFNLCTEEDINKRPSAEEIVEQLKALV